MQFFSLQNTKRYVSQIFCTKLLRHLKIFYTTDEVILNHSDTICLKLFSVHQSYILMINIFIISTVSKLNWRFILITNRIIHFFITVKKIIIYCRHSSCLYLNRYKQYFLSSWLIYFTIRLAVSATNLELSQVSHSNCKNYVT